MRRVLSLAWGGPWMVLPKATGSAKVVRGGDESSSRHWSVELELGQKVQ